MSALFCLEAVLDEMAQHGAPLRAITTRVLSDATTLATPGLVFGFLARHIEKVTDELDDFLACPEVWALEFNRALAEGTIHVQGPDRADLVGRERRRWTPREVAMHLVIAAAQRGDSVALERLGAVGRRLVKAAGDEKARPEVRLWAAHLHWESYTIQENGTYRVIELIPPEDVAQALAPVRAESANVFAMYGLMHRYRPRAVTPYRSALAAPSGADQLASDFSTAQRLQAQLDDTANELDQLRLALAGVAAALIEAALHGLSIPEQSLPWALSVLGAAAINPHLGEFPTERAVFPEGSDRKAALALPLVLLLSCSPQAAASSQHDGDNAEWDLRAALIAGTTSYFIEVRQNAAEGLRSILAQPCAAMSDGRCWHELAWDAIEAGTRRVVLGPRRAYRERQVEAITGDLVDELSNRHPRDLMLTHITPPAICVLEAARSDIVSRCKTMRPLGIEPRT